MPTSDEMYRRIAQAKNELNGLRDEARRNPAGIVVIARHELERLLNQVEEMRTIREYEIQREILKEHCTTTETCTHKKRL